MEAYTSNTIMKPRTMHCKRTTGGLSKMHAWRVPARARVTPARCMDPESWHGGRWQLNLMMRRNVQLASQSFFSAYAATGGPSGHCGVRPGPATRRELEMRTVHRDPELPTSSLNIDRPCRCREWTKEKSHFTSHFGLQIEMPFVIYYLLFVLIVC